MSEKDPHLHSESAAAETSSRALTEALSSSSAVLKVVMIGLLVYFGFSNCFRVKPGQRALVLRFGKSLQTDESELLTEGIRFAWPYPIDERVIMPGGNQKVRAVNGWYTTEAPPEARDPMGQPIVPPFDAEKDGYLITRDWSIIHAKASFEFSVESPVDYAFKFENLERMLQITIESAMTGAAIEMSTDEILSDQSVFERKVEQRMKRMIDGRGLGVKLVSVKLDDKPIVPRQTKGAYDNAMRAPTDVEEARVRAIAQAHALTSQSASEAEQILSTGRREIKQLTSQAKADADRIDEITRKNDSREKIYLFMQEQLLETLSRVMNNSEIEKWLISTRSDGPPREIRLKLNPEPPEPRRQPQPPTLGQP